MKFKTFFFSVFTIGLLALASCGGDDDVKGCSTAYGTELQNELNALSSAATAYGSDPTNNTKCIAYKNAIQAYVNKLRPYGNCASLTGQNRTQWQAALDNYDGIIATLCVP